MATQRFRIFVIESPDPIDLLENRSESSVIQVVADLLGHDATEFFAKSAGGLKEISEYIASLAGSNCSTNSQKRPMCVHLSAHGNESGMWFGPHLLKWPELFEALKSVFGGGVDYSGPRLLVLSACNADSQKLTEKVQEQIQGGAQISPPPYVFVSSGEIGWDDAAVAWVLFYRLMADVDLDEPKAVREVLDRIKSVGLGGFLYFRWDRQHKQYRRYTAK